MLANRCGCLFFHICLDVFGAFVQEEERFLVHPGVERRLIVDIGAVDHEVGVGMVLVVNNVIARQYGYKVLDESMCESRLTSLLFFMSAPQLSSKNDSKFSMMRSSLGNKWRLSHPRSWLRIWWCRRRLDGKKALQAPTLAKTSPRLDWPLRNSSVSKPVATCPS